MRKYVVFMFISLTFDFCTQAQDIELVDFNHSQCDRSIADYTIRSRIISKTLNADTLLLSVGFGWACCMEFTGIAEMKNDTLHVKFLLQNDNYCFCTCCYQADFKIKGINNIHVPIKFYNKLIEQSHEKFETFPVTFELVKGDTINLTDKYGLKQGKWVYAKKQYLLYENNKLAGWGDFKPGGKIEEYNTSTKKVTVYNSRGKVLKRYVKSD